MSKVGENVNRIFKFVVFFLENHVFIHPLLNGQLQKKYDRSKLPEMLKSTKMGLEAVKNSLELVCGELLTTYSNQESFRLPEQPDPLTRQQAAEQITTIPARKAAKILELKRVIDNVWTRVKDKLMPDPLFMMLHSLGEGRVRELDFIQTKVLKDYSAFKSIVLVSNKAANFLVIIFKKIWSFAQHGNDIFERTVL